MIPLDKSESSLPIGSSHGPNAYQFGNKHILASMLRARHKNKKDVPNPSPADRGRESWPGLRKDRNHKFAPENMTITR
jgi:hypothetical protein